MLLSLAIWQTVNLLVPKVAQKELKRAAQKAAGLAAMTAARKVDLRVGLREIGWVKTTAGIVQSRRNMRHEKEI